MKVIKKLFLLCSFFLSVNKINGCDCKQVSPLTIIECRKFDAIIQCKIDSVSTCNQRSIAYAKCIEIYKGEPVKQVQFSFDCSTSCQLSFAKNERWLIYGKLNDQNQLELNFCDRNRKYFESTKDDYFLVNTGLSFADEINYLKKNIGLKIGNTPINNVSTIDITQRENALTSGSNNLLLLLASLFFFLLIYFIVNKKLK